MRQCEFKRRYDPDMGMYVKKNIYGEGITDVFKSVELKLFGQTDSQKCSQKCSKKGGHNNW